MLVEASGIASYAGDVTPTAELGRRAAALPVEDKVGEFLSELSRAWAAWPRATRSAERRCWAGVAAFVVGEQDKGGALYTRAVARARQEGAVELLPVALEYLAPTELVAGRSDAATASATEGLRLARETGNDTSACRHLATLAHPAALRGDEAACRSAAAEALKRAAARGLGRPATLARNALGLLELGLGRTGDALAQFQELLARRTGRRQPLLRRLRRPGPGRGGRPQRPARGRGRPPGRLEQLASMAGTELRATGETAASATQHPHPAHPQELQIVRLVGEGGTNREIGAQLFLSRRTIDYHLRNVFVKLGVSSRAELIRLALANG